MKSKSFSRTRKNYGFFQKSIWKRWIAVWQAQDGSKSSRKGQSYPKTMAGRLVYARRYMKQNATVKDVLEYFRTA